MNANPKIWITGADGKMKEGSIADMSKYAGMGDLAPTGLQINTEDTRVYDGHFWIEKDGRFSTTSRARRLQRRWRKRETPASTNALFTPTLRHSLPTQ